MAMALHPEKLRKAQAELDDVLGMERMPKISDKVNLPYVNALIKEVMRWNPAVPLGEFPCADPRSSLPVQFGWAAAVQTDC